LSGTGSDQYLTGNHYYLADLMARGRLITALREAADWSVERRLSFWRLVRVFGLEPLLPRWVRDHGGKPSFRPPPWIRRGFATRYGIASRLPVMMNGAGAWGHKFDANVALQLDGLGFAQTDAIDTPTCEIRYPFLYRPLVDFSLTLPRQLIMQPYARKWVLRAAMKGVLPDTVRLRTGKGGGGTRLRWALTHRREVVDNLVTSPILADLGCIRPRVLARAIESIRAGKPRSTLDLFSVLSLEMWLRVRAGQWVARRESNTSAGSLVLNPIKGG
jgi:asparagine synthase (glutamine-hydrolysing)